MSSSIILGIDPGLATLGFAVISSSSRENQTVLKYGTINTPAKETSRDRLAQIYTELTNIIKEYKPTLVAVEQLYFGKNTKTAMLVGQAVGVIMLCASQNNIFVVEYTPLQVKLALTGYGRADKGQMQKMVQQLLKLDELPKPDDAADALAVAVTAAVSGSVH